MYLDHYGLDQPPFRITPHTQFFFAGARRGATLQQLRELRRRVPAPAATSLAAGLRG